MDLRYSFLIFSTVVFLGSSCSSEYGGDNVNTTRTDSVAVDSIAEDVNPNPSTGPLQEFLAEEKLKPFTLPIKFNKQSTANNSGLDLNADIVNQLELMKEYNYQAVGYISSPKGAAKIIICHGINAANESIDGLAVFLDQNNKVSDSRTIYNSTVVAGTRIINAAEFTQNFQLIQKMEAFENKTKTKEDISYFNLDFERGIFEKIK